MRVKWEPVFTMDGQEVLSQGSDPLLETVQFSKILLIIQLHDGIMGHAAARRLDRSHYVFEDGAVLSIFVDIPLRIVDETLHRVEGFMQAVGFFPECDEDPAGVAWLHRSESEGVKRASFSASLTKGRRPNVA